LSLLHHRQTYPRDRYEIILADAHSKDRTREIAKKYNAIVLDDNGKNMEEGKRLALGHATGDYIVFVDADNENQSSRLHRTGHQVAGRQPAGVGCGGVLSAVQQDEFVLRVSFPIYCTSRSDCLVDEPESSARGAERPKSKRWTLKGESWPIRSVRMDSRFAVRI